MIENTLLGRCTAAYCEGSITSRAGVAAILDHIAAEILVMHQRNPRLTVFEIARLLRLEAAGELAGWEAEE